MRSLVLSLVLGLATLGTLWAPTKAEAHHWEGGYYPTPAWRGGSHYQWRGGSHYQWRGGSHYAYPGTFGGSYYGAGYGYSPGYLSNSFYGGGYGYSSGFPGVSISFTRGYYSPGYLSTPYYSPLYDDLDLGYSLSSSLSSYSSLGSYAPRYSATIAPSAVYQAATPPRLPPAREAVTRDIPAAVEPATTDGPAVVEVKAPADAEIWFGSYRSHQTGTIRLFKSPTLTAGMPYTYKIRARWDQDGRPVDQTRTVAVSAGQVARVDFLTEDGPEAVPAPDKGASAPPVRDDRTSTVSRVRPAPPR